MSNTFNMGIKIITVHVIYPQICIFVYHLKITLKRKVSTYFQTRNIHYVIKTYQIYALNGGKRKMGGVL